MCSLRRKQFYMSDLFFVIFFKVFFPLNADTAHFAATCPQNVFVHSLLHLPFSGRTSHLLRTKFYTVTDIHIRLFYGNWKSPSGCILAAEKDSLLSTE